MNKTPRRSNRKSAGTAKSPTALSIPPQRKKLTADGARGASSAKLSASAREFPIVALGASAGGLEATTQLLRHLPDDTGMAFVLVQHLDPTHKSALTALLSRTTAMPVREASNNLQLEPNHLYVIPPNKLMGISARRLKLTPRHGTEVHASVDLFLQSLAEQAGSSAIGIILSGNGSDGTAGLQAVKAAGGITFAQDEKTAKYSAMPGSAITAGCVDFVLSPERIATELARISGHPYVSPGGPEEIASPLLREDKPFTDVLSMLRTRTGVDFTDYKHATLRRRIQRRMVLHKIEELKDYAQFVRGHAGEVKELFNDLLIHVTSFFRDTAVFKALKKRIFPRLVKAKASNEAIRIWVPGCSTGEEVYSVAMVFLEVLQDRKLNCHLHIFGTDINENALAMARAGVYPEAIQKDVSADRLRRFFTRVDGGFRINKTIREMCIFARQNVVSDPPFSNLDLISCRNVLIYLGQPLQRRVFPLFHYALKPTGLLLLGTSETIGGFADLFGLLDQKARVYSKKSTHLRPSVAFGSPFPTGNLDQAAEPTPAQLPANFADVQKHADRILLTHYSPTGVVINRELEVLQFRGRTGEFLEHTHGEASLNLLKMAREGLLIELRAATTQAMKQNMRTRRENIRVKENGHFNEISIEVVPFQVPPNQDRYYLVLFEAAPRPLTETEEKTVRGRRERTHKGAADAEMVQLREELASTRDSLQAIIAEQEATNEELRSANEEIMSSNEELQSTNEELETAKEELQSTNEELTTLNEELENRNHESEGINNDLQNLLGSVDIPILILGQDLRIRRFTAAAEKLLNLIPADVGRPVTDIALKVDLPGFPKLVMDVIDSLVMKELEVQDRDNRWWSVRIRPYKTTSGKIDGAVVALVDIDALKASAESVAQGRAFAEAIVNTVRQPLLVLDKDLLIKSANPEFCRTFKVTPAETLNRRIYDLGSGQWNIPRLRTLLEEILPQNSHFQDFEVSHDFPDVGPKTMRLNARRLAYDPGRRPLILLAIEEVKEPGNSAH